MKQPVENGWVVGLKINSYNNMEMKLKTNPPTVFCEIIELKHDRGHYLLKVENCPHCGKKHYHGLPRGGLKMREFGHRLSHCSPEAKPNPGYFLVKNPTTASKDKAGRV